MRSQLDLDLVVPSYSCRYYRQYQLVPKVLARSSQYYSCSTIDGYQTYQQRATVHCARSVALACGIGMQSFWCRSCTRDFYSSLAVQPRKPFVQEISRKKSRMVFQCPPYIFPYILSPYIMHVLYQYRSTLRRFTVPVHGTSSDLQHACTAVLGQI